jgi:hypothetical protein
MLCAIQYSQQTPDSPQNVKKKEPTIAEYKAPHNYKAYVLSFWQTSYVLMSNLLSLMAQAYSSDPSMLSIATVVHFNLAA